MVLSFLLAAAASACSTSDDTTPGEGVCNMENPAQLRKYDAANGCTEAPVATPGVCVGTASEGAGLSGVACAFAPDGTIYVDLVCENCVVSGDGFTYSQYTFGGLTPASQPGQLATSDQIARCNALMCVPDCTTGAPLLQSNFQCGALDDAGAGRDAGP